MPTPLTPTALMITHDGMSTADPALAHKLAGTFLGLLDIDDKLPRVICFYGDSVKLAVEGSPVLEEQAALAEHGVELIACGTCLNHFDLGPNLRVDREGTMKDILAAQWECGKVLTIQKRPGSITPEASA